jgi:Dolichyl-phosphate-mannose-protein mannosyltransferase
MGRTPAKLRIKPRCGSKEQLLESVRFEPTNVWNEDCRGEIIPEGVSAQLTTGKLIVGEPDRVAPDISAQRAAMSERTFGRWKCAATTVLPYVLALLFALLALRGALSTDVVDPDAARHGMNGVFLHDLIREGQIGHPVAYAKKYYSHFPALSLPYHPPLLPLAESIFFFLFGVHYFVARLLISLFTGGSVVLFYKLVLKTGGSHFLAVASIMTFFVLRGSYLLSRDIMLEFPALFFALGALHFLADPDADLDLRSSLGFALLAAAAVWTKQQTIFLGAVPFAHIVIARKWDALKNRWFWFSAAAFGVLVAVLAAVSIGSGFGTNPEWRHGGIADMAAKRVLAYAVGFRVQFTLVPALFIAGSFLFFLFVSEQNSGFKRALYLAWVLAVSIELLFLPPYDGRYLFFMQPPLIILAYAALCRLSELVLRPSRAWLIPSAVVVAVFVLNVARVPVRLQGPSTAARLAAGDGNNRILYFGRTNGAFIFALRTLDPKLGSVVIRGDKLSSELLQADRFEAFAHDYGVDFIILEQTNRTVPWDELLASPTGSMHWQADIPLRCSFPDRSGTLHIYRFTNPSPNPKQTILMEKGIYRRDVDLTEQ